MGNAHNVAFVFSGHPMETCLPVGHSELIPLFALLIQVAFGLPIKLYLPQPKSLLTFTLLILSHIPPEQEICVWFSCWLGLNYNRAQLCSLPETVFGKDYVQRKEEATETERGNEIQIQQTKLFSLKMSQTPAKCSILQTSEQQKYNFSCLDSFSQVNLD